MLRSDWHLYKRKFIGVVALLWLLLLSSACGVAAVPLTLLAVQRHCVLDVGGAYDSFLRGGPMSGEPGGTE